MTTPCRTSAYRGLAVGVRAAGVALLVATSSFGGTALQSFRNGSLYHVDYQRERVTSVGIRAGVPVPANIEMDLGGAFGAAVDPRTRSVYRVATVGLNGGLLLRIDPPTGVADYVGPDTFPSTEPPIPVDPTSPGGLSYDPATRDLYTLNALPESQVVRIDPLTGAGEIVGTIETRGIGATDLAEDLVINPRTGAAYVTIDSADSGVPHLWSLDLSTLEATIGPELAVPDGSTRFRDMSFDPTTGRLIGSVFNEPHLYVIDVETGGATVADSYLPAYLPDDVLRFGFGEFALVAAVPEPGSAGMLLSAAVAAGSSSRRSRIRPAGSLR